VVIGRYVVRLAGRFEPAVLEQVVDMLERRGG
jgi:acetolactate synthase regulatory subunit